jgi:hypothetical protein
VKKTVLTFGLVSGAVSAVILLATIPYINSINFRRADILGYTGIVLTALLVFFGVRSYRENAGGHRLTFGRAFAVGLLITLISCASHIVTFQILYFKAVPGLGEKYAACMVERTKASGASQQKVDQTMQQAQTLKRLYDNPATNAALTFGEAFPVGLIATTLSAAILRKKGTAHEN